jgi:hypothetical protein
MCALVVSASLAYAVNGALAGMAPGQNTNAPLVSQTLDRPILVHIQTTGLDASKSCDSGDRRLLYVGLNTWILAEPQVAGCP